MGNTGFKMSLVFFILYIYRMKNYERKESSSAL